MRSRDTSIDVHERQLARIRAMTSAERAAEAEQLCRTARELMRSGIRARHPEYDTEAVELALLRLVLDDDDFFRAAKPGAPLLPP